MIVDTPQVKPLPYRRRQYLFFLLLALFVTVLPFLYLYAVGYRFEFGDRNFISSTGGIYVAAERTGAEIYIDDELVRETRVFRRAFYAQSLETGTHRVHVQKEGNHTWVKELPVYPHIVTEAQAFNLPLVPQVRIISPRIFSTVPVITSTTSLQEVNPANEYLVASSSAVSLYAVNEEYENLIDLFVATSSTSTVASDREAGGGFMLPQITVGTTTQAVSTTTKESSDVRLFERGGEIYAAWVGGREGMPYYYCSEPFPPYSTTTPQFQEQLEKKMLFGSTNKANTAELLHPVQTVPEDADCDPEIRIDRRGQTVEYFDFLPGSTDFVILGLEDGIYVSEIDNRAWQNIQPVMTGEGLTVRVEDGSVYVYDEELIYEVITQ